MSRRRSLGQHYLVDHEVVRDIMREIPCEGTQRILEIGTGKGILTSQLCRIAPDLEAYEIDRVNYELTRKVIVGFPRVRLKLADAFTEASDFDVLVSSLPYSESSRFVGWLSSRSYSKAIVVLQEDFVRKLMARPGQRGYRAISVIAQCGFRLEILKRIGRSSFQPPPKVSSVLVTIRPASKLNPDLIVMLKRLFSVKKRKLGAALKVLKLGSNPPISDMQRRIYQMEPDELRRIAEGILGFCPRATKLH